MAEYTASLGRIGDPPVRVGADVASLNTGIFAAQAILAALFHRMRTGEGQRVAVSQFGSLLHMRGIMWHSMSDPDDWYGFHLDHYTKPPDYGYQTKNGSLYFILRRGNSEDWDRLVIELGMEEVLADPRFADYGRAGDQYRALRHRGETIWEKAFKNRTREELIALINSIGGDAVPIHRLPVAARSSADRGTRVRSPKSIILPRALPDGRARSSAFRKRRLEIPVRRRRSASTRTKF